MRGAPLSARAAPQIGGVQGLHSDVAQRCVTDKERIFCIVVDPLFSRCAACAAPS